MTAESGHRGSAPGASDFVVVANRLPVDLERLPDGTTEWKRSPGGLVTALEPILRSRAAPGSAGRACPTPTTEPFGEDGMQLHPVPLSAPRTSRDYYEGFSNATLWPLYHDAVATPVYHRHWWDAYVEVNRRFAEAAAEAAAEGATVWVQDYQLQLVPAMLRELRPDLRIGFFLHIPFPPLELFMQLPWRTEIVEGLLGADLVGFQLPGGAQNFLQLAAARRRDTSRATRRAVAVRRGARRVPHRPVGAFPISIDAAAARRAGPRTERSGSGPRRSAPSSATRARSCSASTGSTTPRASTSGCARSTELLDEDRVDRDDTVMVQVATPSRERVEHYQRLRDDIEREVGRINGELRRGRPAGRALPAPVAAARGAGRALPRRRRHAGDPAARRDEPGRQGVRRLPQRPRRRAGAQRVRRRRRRAAAGVPGQPARHSTGSRTRSTRRSTMSREEGGRRMRALRRQVLAHDVDRWARSSSTRWSNRSDAVDPTYRRVERAFSLDLPTPSRREAPRRIPTSKVVLQCVGEVFGSHSSPWALNCFSAVGAATSVTVGP